MQRKLATVAGALAPLLAAALLLQVALACCPPLAAPDEATGAPNRVSTTTAAGQLDEAQAGESGAATRSARITSAARVEVTRLAERGGQPPDQSVMASFDRRPCGSVNRSGRTCYSIDRRDPAAQENQAAPDAYLGRDDTADKHSRTAAPTPDHIRLRVLRC